MTMHGSAQAAADADDFLEVASPLVGVVLLNWNGWVDTIECLESLYAQEYSNYCIIVCDNASTDGSLDHISRWAREQGRAVTIVRDAAQKAGHVRNYTSSTEPRLVLIDTGANRGFAAGNNYGLRYLLGEKACAYAWILNNDTVVAPNALSRLVARAEMDHSLGAVAGTLLDFSRPEIIQEAGAQCSNWHGCSYALDAGEQVHALTSATPRIDYGTGGCVLVRTETIRRIGLLDERFFMYSEDADWGIRMRRAGAGLGRAVDAHVWHKGGSSTQHYSPLHDYLVVKSALLLIHKHHPARLPVAFIYSLYRCLAPKLLRREGRRLGAVLRAYRDVALVVSGQRDPWAPERPVAAKAGG